MSTLPCVYGGFGRSLAKTASFSQGFTHTALPEAEAGLSERTRLW